MKGWKEGTRVGEKEEEGEADVKGWGKGTAQQPSREPCQQMPSSAMFKACLESRPV